MLDTCACRKPADGAEKKRRSKENKDYALHPSLLTAWKNKIE